MANRTGESVGIRARARARTARIRSNIADVYGVICGELASPSSGLNSAISGKENSLIKLGQLFRLPSSLSLSVPLPLSIGSSLFPSLCRHAPLPSLSLSSPSTIALLHVLLFLLPPAQEAAVGRRGGGETADSDVTRLDSFSSDLRGR